MSEFLILNIIVVSREEILGYIRKFFDIVFKSIIGNDAWVASKTSKTVNSESISVIVPAW